MECHANYSSVTQFATIVYVPSSCVALQYKLDSNRICSNADAFESITFRPGLYSNRIQLLITIEKKKIHIYIYMDILTINSPFVYRQYYHSMNRFLSLVYLAH